MSTKQQTILGILGIAIVLVYGFLGAYALIHLTQGDSIKSGGSEQAAGILPSDPGPGVTSATTDATTLPSSAEGGTWPTNTRVIPPDTGVSPPPAATATSRNADSRPPTDTAQSTSTGPAPATPPPPAATPASPLDTPTPAPASPTPQTSCVDDENALHQQKLAEIDAQYEPMFTWLDAEMEHAERTHDDVRLEEVRRERGLFESMKAADLEEENQRHAEALAACAS